MSDTTHKQITETILQLQNDYEKSAYKINDGLCEEFAMQILKPPKCLLKGRFHGTRTSRCIVLDRV